MLYQPFSECSALGNVSKVKITESHPRSTECETILTSLPADFDLLKFETHWTTHFGDTESLHAGPGISHTPLSLLPAPH